MSRLIMALLVVGLTLSSTTGSSADTILPPPTSLTQVGPTTSIAAGGWINQRSITLRFQVMGTGSPLIPQIELRSADQSFTGQLTSQGAAVTSVSGQLQTASTTVRSLRSKTRFNLSRHRR